MSYSLLCSHSTPPYYKTEFFLYGMLFLDNICFAWAKQRLTSVTSSILQPALHHTLGASVSHTEVGVQLTRLLYCSVLFPAKIWSCTDSVNKNRLIESARDSLYSPWPVHTRIHRDTSARVRVSENSTGDMSRKSAADVGCKVMQMEAGKPCHYDNESTSCPLVFPPPSMTERGWLWTMTP